MIKQTVYVVDNGWMPNSIQPASKEIKDVYILTEEELLALRKKWAAEAIEAVEPDVYDKKYYRVRDEYTDNLKIE